MNLAQYNISEHWSHQQLLNWIPVGFWCLCVYDWSHGSGFDCVLIAETSFIANDYRRLWTPIFLAQHSVTKWERWWTLHFFIRRLWITIYVTANWLLWALIFLSNTARLEISWTFAEVNHPSDRFKGTDFSLLGAGCCAYL